MKYALHVNHLKAEKKRKIKKSWLSNQEKKQTHKETNKPNILVGKTCRKDGFLFLREL